MPFAAVVGHVEWVEFIRVERTPAVGEIVHAREWFEAPAGGGPGAAVQLAKLAGEATLFTALGDDDIGHRAERELGALGLRVKATFRPEPSRRAITHIDETGERTITVLGERLAPKGSDSLPWDELGRADAVYFTAGDVEALHWARRARVVTATARVLSVLKDAQIELDALVGSALDPSEVYVVGDLDPPPRLVVRTEGDKGGTFEVRGGHTERFSPAPIPGALIDRYGAGDSFAGGLTYALGRGRSPVDAVTLAARCGAAALTGRGPYEGQLRDADL